MNHGTPQNQDSLNFYNSCLESPKVPETVDTGIPILQGQQIAECPPNFLVVRKLLCEDGTVYAAGYIKEHHPAGVPEFALTYRRITLKTGEQRRIDKWSKAIENIPRPLMDTLFTEDPLDLEVGP